MSLADQLKIEGHCLHVGNCVVPCDDPVVLRDAVVKLAQEHWVHRRRMPTTRQGLTRKVKVGNVEMYVTAGFYNTGELGEVFLTIAKEGSTLAGLMDAWVTTISVALQSGVSWDVLAKKYDNQMFPPE